MHPYFAFCRLSILALWIAFILYWVISARHAKKVISRQTNPWRYATIAGLVIIFAVIPRHVRAMFIIYSVPVQTAGVAVTALGIAIAIWARRHLGRNWSAVPSVVEEHQLVTTGPYSLVRHPIYTGIILALFASAFVVGLVGIYLFITDSIFILLRVKQEDNIMLQLFPLEYPPYKQRTKALIPFIW